MIIDSELRSKDTWLISEDGLWDICIGLSLLGFGLTVSLSHPIWFVGFIMLSYFLVVVAGKEVITRPRMINFTIRDEQLIRLAKMIRIGLVFIVLSLAAGAFAFLVFDTGTSFNWFPEYGVTILSVFLSFVLFILGYISREGFRYYFYAGISLLGIIIFELLYFPKIMFVYTAAIFMTVSGLGLLVRFITRYPKPNTRENVKL